MNPGVWRERGRNVLITVHSYMKFSKYVGIENQKVIKTPSEYFLLCVREEKSKKITKQILLKTSHSFSFRKLRRLSNDLKVYLHN